MIKFTTGDLLEAEVDALVNTVNTVGVMMRVASVTGKRSGRDGLGGIRKRSGLSGRARPDGQER